MIRTEAVEITYGSTADVQDRYRYPGIPQSNGNHKAATRSEPQPNA